MKLKSRVVSRSFVKSPRLVCSCKKQWQSISQSALTHSFAGYCCTCRHFWTLQRAAPLCSQPHSVAGYLWLGQQFSGSLKPWSPLWSLLDIWLWKCQKQHLYTSVMSVADFYPELVRSAWYIRVICWIGEANDVAEQRRSIPEQEIEADQAHHTCRRRTTQRCERSCKQLLGKRTTKMSGLWLSTQCA